MHIAEHCELLVRGFARVGIIALIDEVTGYQRDRASDALAKILEAFIDKELRAWVQTFPADFYEQLFRLRGLEFPKDSVKRPQYFGKLTNDIVYKRIAPGVLAKLKEVTPRDEEGRLKHKYFQRLTSNVGYPKLLQHLGSVVSIMKLSDGWNDFSGKLDRLHPRYGDTMPLPMDDGKGI
jgi:P63C domain-containing protein